MEDICVPYEEKNYNKFRRYLLYFDKYDPSYKNLWITDLGPALALDLYAWGSQGFHGD